MLRTTMSDGIRRKRPERGPSLMKKVIKMNKELHEAMIRQVESFKEKFGREPGPDDPLFFDPEYNVPTPLTEAKVKRGLVEAAHKAGLDVDRVLRDLGFEDKEESVAKNF